MNTAKKKERPVRSDRKRSSAPVGTYYVILASQISDREVLTRQAIPTCRVSQDPKKKRREIKK